MIITERKRIRKGDGEYETNISCFDSRPPVVVPSNIRMVKGILYTSPSGVQW